MLMGLRDQFVVYFADARRHPNDCLHVPALILIGNLPTKGHSLAVHGDPNSIL